MGQQLVAKKKSDLDSVIASLNKQFGDSTVRIVTGEIEPIKRSSTGIMQLDAALFGGWPHGRICEIFGRESGGKTTICLHSILTIQRSGGTCAFIDAEHTFSPEWAMKIGVDCEKLLVSQPGCGEEALIVCETLAKTGMVDLIVIDSIAALTPRAEVEGEIGDNHVGLQARMIGQAVRKMTKTVYDSDCIVLCINQLRSTISQYGPDTTTPGGKGFRHHASVRVEVSPGAKKTLPNGEVYGTETKVYVHKNKTAPQFQKATMTMISGFGFCPVANTVEQAIERGVIEKNGAWMSFDGRRYQGLVKTIDAFRENPEEFAKLKAAVLSKQSLVE